RMQLATVALCSLHRRCFGQSEPRAMASATLHIWSKVERSSRAMLAPAGSSSCWATRLPLVAVASWVMVCSSDMGPSDVVKGVFHGVVPYAVATRQLGHALALQTKQPPCFQNIPFR